MVTKEKVLNQLKEVVDPELGINIVDLGLVYGVKITRGGKGEGLRVAVEMTLTSPGCPLAPVIHAEVERVVMELKEIDEVELQIVWDPPWSLEKASKEVRLMFGF